jgi:hypothetical protein
MTIETHAPLLTSALGSISTGQQAWADAGADRCLQADPDAAFAQGWTTRQFLSRPQAREVIDFRRSDATFRLWWEHWARSTLPEAASELRQQTKVPRLGLRQLIQSSVLAVR